MPVVVVQSPKGGSGKTTSSLLLGLTLSKFYSTTIIDADPNRPIKNWASGGNTPSNVTIIDDADENNILERIEEASAKTQFVIVDLEGSAAKITLLAVSQADLVIIPTQGSPLDAKEASKGVRVIKQQEKMTKRKTPYAVLLTRTSVSVRTRSLGHIQQSLLQAGIPVFQIEINDREAYRAMFDYQMPLTELNAKQAPNLKKAIENAEYFALEVIHRIMQQSEDKIAQEVQMDNDEAAEDEVAA